MNCDDRMQMSAPLIPQSQCSVSSILFATTKPDGLIFLNLLFYVFLLIPNVSSWKGFLTFCMHLSPASELCLDVFWFCYGNYAGIVQLRGRMTGDETWKNMEELVMWSMWMVGYKNVFEVKYLRIVATNQNYLHKEIMNSLNLGIACQYSVHIALFSHVLFKNISI